MHLAGYIAKRIWFASSRDVISGSLKLVSASALLTKLSVDPIEVDSPVLFSERVQVWESATSKSASTNSQGRRKFCNFSSGSPQMAIGVADEGIFRTRIINFLVGCESNAAVPREAAAIRRPWCESHVIYVVNLRHRTECADDDCPRRILQAERKSRRVRLSEKLSPGLKLEKELQPASYLVARFVQMSEHNAVQWEELMCCVVRAAEIVAVPKQRWMPDAKGTIQESAVKQELQEDIHESIGRFVALQRPGSAAEIAGVVSFGEHELIRRMLSSALSFAALGHRHQAP